MPAELHLLRPYWLLALAPLVAVLVLWWRRRGDTANWSRVCDPALLPFLLLPGQSAASRRWLQVLGLIGLLAILALAGPAWKKLEQPVFRDPSALVILLDLSRSMDSRDLQPSRLVRARLKLLDILNQRREGQTALVVYAAQAFAVVPLTDDSDTIAALAASLDTSLMPGQGSRPDRALDQALELLAQAGVPRGDILVIADSSGSAPPDQAVARAVTAGHRVHVLGVGTPEGAPIPAPGGGFVKDPQGNIVVPALERDALHTLATRGEGRYADLSLDDRDLVYLLSGLGRPSPLTEAQEAGLSAERWREEGPWLLLLALPLAALAFRRGYLLVLLAMLVPLPPPVQALEWPDWWQRPDQQAADLLGKGDATEAARRFADPEWKAAAHYRAGAYEETVSALADLETPDALYNKGNALARAGRLQEALRAYDQALEHQPGHEDAAYNRELVEEALNQQTQPETQQGDEESQPNQQEDQPQNQGQDGDQGSESEGSPEDGGQDSGPEESPGQESEPQPPDPPDSSQGEQGREQDSPQESPQRQQSEPGDSAEEPAPGSAQAAEAPEDSAGAEQAEAQGASEEPDPELAEESQARRQWLRRIPDDPGGLLRRKFRYQYQRLAEPQPETQNW